MLFFEIQGNEWNASLMRISYKMTKRTPKTEKIENYLKMYIIIFLTIRYELAASVESLIQSSITSL